MIGPARPLRFSVMVAIAQDERLEPGMVVWLYFIINNGLQDEGITLLRRNIEEEEHSEDEDDNIAIVDDSHDNDDEVQAEDAAAEPRADLEVIQPVEAEVPLRSRKNEVPDIFSSSHTEDEDPPRGSRRRAREEDDEEEGRVSKQLRH